VVIKENVFLRLDTANKKVKRGDLEEAEGNGERKE